MSLVSRRNSCSSRPAPAAAAPSRAARAVSSAAAVVVEGLEGRRLMAVTTELVAPLIAPGSPEDFGQYGFAVAAQGDWVLVGQPAYDDPAHPEFLDVGRVVLFNTATEARAEIINPAPGDTDQFGFAVEILNNGQLAIASAESFDAGGAGAVWIFDNPLLTNPQQTVVNPGTPDLAGQPGQGLGGTLAAFGADGLLVFLGGDNGVGLAHDGDSSAAAFFNAGTQAGRRMAATGTRAVFSYLDGNGRGVVAEVDTAVGPGVLRTYDLPVLQAPFGFRQNPGLAIAGGVVLVGQGGTATESGVVYQFAATGAGTIDAPAKTYAAPAPSPNFGRAIAVVDGHAVVGDVTHSTAYLFDLAAAGGSAPVATIDGVSGSQFGFALAAASEDGHIAITAPFEVDLDSGNSAGAAYVYRIIADTPPPVADPVELRDDGIVYVTVPTGAAATTILVTGNGTGITVTMGAETLTVATSALTGGRIVVYGSDGAETVAVSAAIKTSIWVFGGAGDDSIRGGSGGDVIVGGDGNDLVVGGQGRDLIVGGTGADRVVGEQEDDILVAGATAHDADATILGQIMTMWTDPLVAFDTRVDGLRSGLLDPFTTVFADGAVDVLTGNNGSDWFIYTSGQDVVTDLKHKDFADDLAFITTLE